MIRRVTRAVMIGAGLALVICTGAPGALPRVAHAQPSGSGPTVAIDTFQFKPRKQDKAVNDLLGYTRDFGAFINSATKTLPTDAVADLVKMHILTLKAVIDAQAAGDQTKTYASLRKAMGHMQMVADPLAEAIVKQFPDRFAR